MGVCVHSVETTSPDNRVVGCRGGVICLKFSSFFQYYNDLRSNACCLYTSARGLMNMCVSSVCIRYGVGEILLYLCAYKSHTGYTADVLSDEKKKVKRKKNRNELSHSVLFLLCVCPLKRSIYIRITTVVLLGYDVLT